MALNISNSLLYSLCHGFRGLSAAEYFLKIVFLAISCHFNKTSSKKRSAIPLLSLPTRNAFSEGAANSAS